MLGSSPPRQNDALWTRVLLAMVDLFVGGTQWVVLSAADEHPWCGASHAGPGRGVDGADGAIQPLAMVLCEPFTQRAGGGFDSHTLEPLDLSWSPPRGLGFSGSPETTGEAPHAALTCPTPPTGPIELVCPRWSHRLDVAPAPGGSEQPPETARRRPVICSGHGDANHARARRARDARLTG